MPPRCVQPLLTSTRELPDRGKVVAGGGGGGVRNAVQTLKTLKTLKPSTP